MSETISGKWWDFMNDWTQEDITNLHTYVKSMGGQLVEARFTFNGGCEASIRCPVGAEEGWALRTMNDFETLRLSWRSTSERGVQPA